MEEIKIKHKQHYVFQAYLKNWATNNQIWCCRNKQAPFISNTINVAQMRDFYKVKDINEDEEKLLLLSLGKQPDDVIETVKKQIKTYQKPLEWQSNTEKIISVLKGVLSKQRIVSNGTQQAFLEMEKIAKKSVNDMIEEMYCDEEANGLKKLELIQNGNLDFYYSPSKETNDEFDDTKRSFLYFLCSQYFRTKAVKERWILSMNSFLDDTVCYKLGVKKENIRLDHLTHHIFWYVACQLTDVLYNKNAHLTILINNTGIPFITSDQPVINIKANYQKLEEETKELLFYYPISPNVAITLNDENSVDKMELSEREVEEYNCLIRDSSYELLIANNKSVLEKYI